MVAEDGKAIVHLTQEDWGVVADTLFYMNTPREVIPEVIIDFRMLPGNPRQGGIELDTSALKITLKAF